MNYKNRYCLKRALRALFSFERSDKIFNLWVKYNFKLIKY